MPGESLPAVNGVPVGIYAGTVFNFEGAVTILPSKLCPLTKPVFAKSVFEFERGAVYVSPYVESSDIIDPLHGHYPGWPTAWKPPVGVFQIGNKICHSTK